MHRSNTLALRLAVAVAAMAALVAGCDIFSNPPAPTPSPSGGAAISTVTPSPTPHLFRSIVLVAQIGEPKKWTPAGLTWIGVQEAAARIGAASSNVEPISNADYPKALDAAATPGAVVVTVGTVADPAVRVAAAAHPTTQFFEVDVALPDGVPANLHGLVFDEAEAGYLGGYVAAAFSGTSGVGMVGDTATDVGSANYAAGFQNGLTQAVPGAVAAFAYVGTADSPDRGRTAAAGLVKAGSRVIMALPSLSGIGAMREACADGARLVAVDTDAWQTVPDIHSCLLVSVMKRYDVAIAAAVLAADAGTAAQRVAMNDVSTGGIALSSFHVELPAGFQPSIEAIIATLRAGPPRATPAPPSAPPSAGGSPTS